jgi:DNA-binding CsgD family transcriptional regulator
VEREGTRLVVRLLTQAGERLLLLEEQRTVLLPTDFEPSGLTRRQAEVLYWVAEGKTDGEIGTILGVSVRTVQKHVEHILTKLGVETRTAAAAWAHQVAGSGRGAGPFQEPRAPSVSAGGAGVAW